ncbi:MAG TPA: endo-1,4-beta-xylanase [Candidatus Acidoferrum sp.]|jgi:hypothetical protein|nr:endo-1,4-beta-xylanase [Candidatus Acidoferrum sp.]
MSRKARTDFARVAFPVLALLFCPPYFISAATDDSNPFGVGSSAQASGLYAGWMPKMAAAGVKWVRIFPDWNQIQPSAGTWNWSLMDSMLNTAATNSLNVSGLFLYNASWLNSNTHTFPTNDYPAWSAYVSNVVRHAAGRVRYWEVWNEPENFTTGGTSADYARVVTNAYNAAKAADPNAQVGLSVASVDILYLEQAIQAGAADHFDYICVHPYEVLGTVDSGQEAAYMNIVPTIRKMLAAKNPAKWKIPIWFTEIGEALGGQVTAASQAQDLVKAYAMAIAQGVSHIEWFEAAEGGYAMGLLNSSGNPVPAYFALKNLAAQLGPNPLYKGWLVLNNKDYGFVFQGVTNSVLAAWAQPNTVDNISFGQTVAAMNPVDGSVAYTTTYSLSNAPVLVIGVPSNLVAQAVTDRSQPFPWGGNYSGVSSISVAMGNPDIEHGLHQLYADAGSTPVTVFGGPARDCSKGSSVTFTVDPNFLSYTHAAINISAVVRKISATDNPGFNLKYESATGRKGIGWSSVPGSDKWYTLTWTVADDEFVGDWGYNFSLDSDSTNYSRYYLQQVTVTNLVPRPASAPTGLIAMPGVGLVSLYWNSVSGATGYNVKRATISGGPYELITPTLSATTCTDASLAVGTPYYYTVSAVNSGGEGPDSVETVATPTPPTLSILLEEGAIRCSWPTSAASFALQETAVVLSSWTNSSAALQVQGSDNVAVVPIVDQAKFYRLVQ